jgi:hypothetical protein
MNLRCESLEINLRLRLVRALPELAVVPLPTHGVFGDKFGSKAQA